MHGEHIKLVLASIAFSNTGIGFEISDMARDVGDALPIDPIAEVLASNKPPRDEDEAYDAWGSAVAVRQVELSRRAIQLAKELDALMRSWLALDHASHTPIAGWQDGLFGPFVAPVINH
ncbi:hypothetical protein [Paraburkholderia ferrariae]|uniref:hypothetical protein n=1 Tax=Paraburkholderia ferrariae TaxID=386056 RepID=UPI00047FFB17|nr:hypothetical protein [Paraburkholderia ferrariae]